MVKKIFAKIYIGLILLIMYAPILLLVVYSFNHAQYINLNQPFGRLTGSLYIDLFKNEEIMTALLNTVLIAISSAIVSTILGTLGAIGIFYSRKRVKKTMSALNQIPVLNAEIVTALSLTILFVSLKSIGVQFSFFTLLIGHVVLTVPFVVLSVIPKLQQMDVNIYEAALDLGATPSKALKKVILPEILPGIFSGFMLSITLSLDDYIITAFTKSDSFTTLSTYVYGVTAKGPLPAELRALTTLIFVGILIGLLIYNFIMAKRAKKNERRTRKA